MNTLKGVILRIKVTDENQKEKGKMFIEMLKMKSERKQTSDNVKPCR